MSLQIYQVQKSGNLFFVNAAVTSTEAEPRILRLLIDTGASQTSLSNILLADLGYTWSASTPKTTMLTGNGLIQTPIVQVRSFNCLGQHLDNLSVLAINLPTSSYINGILGMDFLLRFNALIDVGKQQILLP
jgi:predicted aspartyl protease